MNYDYDLRLFKFGLTDDYQRVSLVAGTNFTYATPLGPVAGTHTSMHYDGDTTSTFTARTSLVGSAFAYNGTGVATAGTLTGLVSTLGFDENNAPMDMAISGISVALPTFQATVQSVDTADDAALLKLILAGADTLDGSAGNDYLFGWTGDDVLYGNAGADTLLGEAGNDSIFGGHGADSIIGGEGADRLSGMSGNDKVFGGAGADLIYGGNGKDALYGGGDKDVDTFFFTSTLDSRPSSNADTIYNFVSGTDKINLAAIDAHMWSAGNQAFGFSNTTAAANSVWYKVSAANIVVYADNNGDGLADFGLVLNTVKTLTMTDFIL
jgi:Ca2+-binding RTX toxin-like protein